MFSRKPENPYLEKVLKDRRELLQENLRSLAVPADEQKKVIAMRDASPEQYHEMGSMKLARCFWVFENFKHPSKITESSLDTDSFRRCVGEFRSATVDEELPKQPPMGMKNS